MSLSRDEASIYHQPEEYNMRGGHQLWEVV